MRSSNAGLISWKVRRGPVFSGARTTSSTTTGATVSPRASASASSGRPHDTGCSYWIGPSVAEERRGVGLLEQRVLRGDERRGRAVARAQEQRLLHRRQLGARAQVGVHVGAAERVDGLLGIADQGQHAGRAGVEEQPAEDLPLRLVGVLELVDQRVAIAGAQRAEQRARPRGSRRPGCAPPASACPGNRRARPRACAARGARAPAAAGGWPAARSAARTRGRARPSRREARPPAATSRRRAGQPIEDPPEDAFFVLGPLAPRSIRARAPSNAAGPWSFSSSAAATARNRLASAAHAAAAHAALLEHLLEHVVVRVERRPARGDARELLGVVARVRADGARARRVDARQLGRDVEELVLEPLRCCRRRAARLRGSPPRRCRGARRGATSRRTRRGTRRARRSPPRRRAAPARTRSRPGCAGRRRGWSGCWRGRSRAARGAASRAPARRAPSRRRRRRRRRLATRERDPRAARSAPRACAARGGSARWSPSR